MSENTDTQQQEGSLPELVQENAVDSEEQYEDDDFEMMEPHWVISDEPRFSIGWRMGPLESYLYKFMDWYNALSPHRQHLVQERYPPNFTWRHFFDDKDYGSSDEEDYKDFLQ